MSTPKYPDVEVQLSGEDGNVFSIMGKVDSALRRAGVSQEDRAAYRAAIFGAKSYDDALRITMEWVAVS